jgi:hypothetical protein
VSIDKSLPCRDCGTSFVFTTGEQEFYASKGFTNEPGRCPECRRTKGHSPARGDRAEYAPIGPELWTQQLFGAVCTQCGKATRAPAQLVLGDAPIYCLECRAARPADVYAATNGWRDSW